jgi:hypothetical protein
MNGHNASSSDLELARELSRRLLGVEERLAPVPYQPIPGCVRFPGAAMPPAQPAASPERVVAPDQPRSFEGWSQVLDWGLDLSGATTGFVMDPEGFAIAHRGPIGGEEIQGLGSQLMVAMSQTDRLEHPGTPALSVCVEYAAFSITGLRVSRGELGPFTLGFIAARPLAPEVRRVIREQVDANLGHL